MALIRMCVLPNCSQQLSQPILWIVTVCATYWTHTTAVCVLIEALTCIWLPAHTHHPLPTNPPIPLICAICDITVAVKKLLKIQQC